MKINIGLIGLILLLFSSCRSAPPEKKVEPTPPESPRVTRTQPKQASVEARQLANEQGPNVVTEFMFKKNSAELTAEARRLLREKFEQAEKRGGVQEVQVITWADRDYPDADQGKLAQGQRQLVERRNEAIEDYLAGLDDGLSIELISMAERPGTWDRFMASDQTGIKKSLEDFSIAETGDDEPTTKTSRSIVIFLHEP
jgi:hypothetical protein